MTVRSGARRGAAGAKQRRRRVAGTTRRAGVVVEEMRGAEAEDDDLVALAGLSYTELDRPECAVLVQCGFARCGTEVEQWDGNACGDKVGVGGEDSCGEVFCDKHLAAAPRALPFDCACLD